MLPHGIFYHINISRLMNRKACAFDSAAAQTSATLCGIKNTCFPGESLRIEGMILMYKKATEDLIKFIEGATDCYQAVERIAEILRSNGYRELYECEKWEVQNGGKYFVVRNLSSVIAFEIPKGEYVGLMVAASHSDSPSYKIKPDAEVTGGAYTRLNVEGYGGMIASTWLDRPLGVSGRIVLKTENGLQTKLVKIDEDFLVIPNLAIHLNRKINEGQKLNPAKDMLPLAGDGTKPGRFFERIAEAAGVQTDAIIAHDLFLYNRMPGSIWGMDGEYFSIGRIDDLQCAYTSLRGFLESDETEALKMYCVFDNEEVGSGTKQGAKSTFLTDVLERIHSALSLDQEKMNRALSSSFMLSADNGHAVHPNLPEMSDLTSRPVLNGGVLIKHNANQKYTTDAVSDAIFKTICQRANVPYQTYTNRSDIPGGSTLGNLANEKLSLNTVDMGAAQLAMHSAYETGGVRDTLYLIQAFRAFYSTAIRALPAGGYEF